MKTKMYMLASLTAILYFTSCEKEIIDPCKDSKKEYNDSLDVYYELRNDLINNHCWPWNGTIAPSCNVTDQVIQKETRMQNAEEFIENQYNSIEDICGEQENEVGEYFD